MPASVCFIENSETTCITTALALQNITSIPCHYMKRRSASSFNGRTRIHRPGRDAVVMRNSLILGSVEPSPFLSVTNCFFWHPITTLEHGISAAVPDVLIRTIYNFTVSLMLGCQYPLCSKYHLVKDTSSSFSHWKSCFTKHSM